MNSSQPKYVIPCRSYWLRVAAMVLIYGTSAALVVGPVLFWWLA